MLPNVSKLMYQYKESNDEILLEKILKAFTPYIRKIALSKISYVKSSMIGVEDLIGIGKYRIWDAIKRFRYYCPECKLISKNRDAFREHTMQAHGKIYLSPAVSIESFVKVNIRMYIGNEIKTENCKKRKGNQDKIPIDIFLPVFEGNNTNDEVIYSGKRALEVAMLNPDFSDEVVYNYLLDIASNEMDDVCKYIVEGIIYNIDQIDIARELCDRGKYKNVQSAAVMVNRIIKTKLNRIFTNFRNVAL